MHSMYLNVSVRNPHQVATVGSMPPAVSSAYIEESGLMLKSPLP